MPRLCSVKYWPQEKQHRHTEKWLQTEVMFHINTAHLYSSVLTEHCIEDIVARGVNLDKTDTTKKSVSKPTCS